MTQASKDVSVKSTLGAIFRKIFAAGIQYKMQTKDVLDKILETHKAQPVGDGYIDIIVHRQNFRDFISAVLAAGFSITDISWWEYVADINDRKTHGYGGPVSVYYPGWFSELVHFDDNLENVGGVASNLADSGRIIKLIESKVLKYPNDKTIAFSSLETLTPAFDIKVPADWRNILQANK